MNKVIGQIKVFQVQKVSGPQICLNKFNRGVVSSYQIGLILPLVAETDPKINKSQCNLQFSICIHAGGKILSLENPHSLF